MNIAVIQASAQIARNQLLFEETKRATSETDDMIFNFGVSSEEDNFSYIQIAICAYTPTPSDAYLFGRINQGNCVSLPFWHNFGWASEINLRFTLEKLFEIPRILDIRKSLRSGKSKML